LQKRLTITLTSALSFLVVFFVDQHDPPIRVNLKR
jgi:hypothetical protein